MLDQTDTIAAIASPTGPGLLGMVRVTGPNAWAVAHGGFSDQHIKPSNRPERRSGWFRVDGLARPMAVSVAFWPEPRTYTGQPLAEIEGSGSPPLLARLLSHCLARGARLAEPGEFTLRAFLSGRIDLTQSEAVLGVIDARTPGQLDAALRQLAGGLASPITSLRDRLADALAHLEANLDFADEADVAPFARLALATTLEAAADDVDRLLGRLQGRDRANGHPRVVLVGPPNAGKSRLFNAIVGLDRAIVSPSAGTTRDYLEASVDCDGLTVDLVDTAGFEAAATPIERRAQSARESQRLEADLRLDCRSDDFEATASSVLLRIDVWTKADQSRPADPSPDLVITSASTGEGLAGLRRAIARVLRSQEVETDLPGGTAVRSSEGLGRAGLALRQAWETLRLGGGDELVAVDLRQALDDLGRVVGAVVTDDLLDRIFRRFCIGK